MSVLSRTCLNKPHGPNLAAFAAFFLSMNAFAAGPGAVIAWDDVDPAGKNGATIESTSEAKSLPGKWAEKYFTLQAKPRIEVIQESEVPTELRAYTLLVEGAPSVGLAVELNEANLILDQIINLGKKVWTIIEANKPVVNLQFDTANGLPQGASSWDTLQGWQTPSSRLYRFSYENLFGMDVVDFEFRVLYTYGGNVHGKGHYLANVTVVPANLSVAWGYTFNARASVPSVLNAGTSEDPIASAQLLVDWKVDTALKHTQSTQSFYVRGDGAFTDLSGGN